MKTWKQIREEEFNKQYAIDLREFIKKEKEKYTIFPADNQLFTAYDLCPLQETKVVIIGQDPFQTPSIAHGLAFSSFDRSYIPPSLKNIYSEIYSNYPNEQKRITTGRLDGWAQQGVLLINGCNTVRANEAASHLGAGWELFTIAMLKGLEELPYKPIVLLWGRVAKFFKVYLPSNCIVLESGHPSAFSAEKNHWFGNGHFKQTNDYLIQQKLKPIDWFKIN